MSISRRERLKRLLAVFEPEDRVCVLINADPDSIASAMAFKRLLARRIESIQLSNINELRRPDNILMVRLLDVQLTPADSISEQDFTKFIILDSQPGHNEIFARFKYHVIIDHHEPEPYEAPFLDIRPEYGACTTILAEYLKAAGIKPSKRLATGMFHAIKTDTHNFEQAAIEADIRTFHELFSLANIPLARRIDHGDLELSFLSDFKRAIEEKKVINDRIYAHLGRVESPDILVLIADFFMRIHTMTWSIVSGLHSGKLVVIFRNDGLRKDAGKVAAKAFGKYGEAGGHRAMGRAEMNTGTIKSAAGSTHKKNLSEWIMGRVEKGLKKSGQKSKK